MDEITHKGIITAIDARSAQVRILQTSACGQCHAKSLCGISEEQEKIIEVPSDASTLYNVGDEVEVSLKRTMGMKAVWIAYVVPLIVLMAAIGTATLCGCTELFAGLAAIASVAVYYLVIFLCRKKLKNEFVFYIK